MENNKYTVVASENAWPQHSPNKRSKYAFAKTVFWVTTAMILILLPLIYFVVVKQSPAKTDVPLNSKYKQNVLLETIAKSSCLIVGKKITLHNAKLSDLDCLSSEVEELNIKSVSDLPANQYFVDIQENKFLRSLVLSCALSGNWLRLLLEKFPNLEKLKYNENNLCKNSFLGINARKFPKFTLRHLNTLVIENINQKCPTSENSFAMWSTPSLKHLKITDSNISQLAFAVVESFMRKNTKSIQKVEILNSFVCKDCDIFSIPFETLQEVHISGRKTTT